MFEMFDILGKFGICCSYVGSICVNEGFIELGMNSGETGFSFFLAAALRRLLLIIPGFCFVTLIICAEIVLATAGSSSLL